MTVSQLQDYVFTSKYSRHLPDLHRRETFEEACDRVLEMHRKHFRERGLELEDLITIAGEAMKRRLVLGSQRALQFGGDPILRKHARLYNCTTSYCDRPRFFQEALWLLLCGCGVGFSVQRHHIDRLPEISRPSGEEAVFHLPDTIEGWADAMGVLLSSYVVSDHPFPEFAGKVVRFDFRAIRPKGSPISGGVGKAPGHVPLERSLELIRALLDRCVSEGRRRLRPIDAYDILMHASDAVLSGGVRRSATICIFSPGDTEMVMAKTGSWFRDNPQRARSNNSALLVRSETTWEQFSALLNSVREYGEPGFLWADHRDVTFNPCGEIGLYPQLDGVSGWAFCNLCEINMGLVDGEAAFTEAATAAAILGTLQADYTSFEYLGPVSTAIARREALLGVSMTGMMERPEVAFDPALQERMAQLILEVNATVAERLGLPPAARATCVKPAGTTSCILGTSSGIHPHHAPRYFRRAQANTDEPLVAFFEKANHLAVERSVWNPNGTDVVLTFCVEPREGAMTKRDLGAMQLLERVQLTQQHWIAAGRRPERCALPGLSHNVSNTITVGDMEWGDVARYIYKHRDAFAGISLLAEGGDLDYPQAPFVEVWTAEEIVRHYGVGAIMASGLIVDGMHAFNNNLWAACDCVLGRGEAVIDHSSRRDWVRRAIKFSDNYFGGDRVRMTRCLKHVNNCKLWEDLQREYKQVDYTQFVEMRDGTGDPVMDGACVSGQCQVIR